MHRLVKWYSTRQLCQPLVHDRKDASVGTALYPCNRLHWAEDEMKGEGCPARKLPRTSYTQQGPKAHPPPRKLNAARSLHARSIIKGAGEVREEI